MLDGHLLADPRLGDEEHQSQISISLRKKLPYKHDGAKGGAR